MKGIILFLFLVGFCLCIGGNEYGLLLAGSQLISLLFDIKNQELAD
jgi:hypothetical protein